MVVPNGFYGVALGFASTEPFAAYEGLSPRMQTYLDGLEAYHSYTQMAERLARMGVTRPGLNPSDHPPAKTPGRGPSSRNWPQALVRQLQLDDIYRQGYRSPRA